MKSLTPKMIDAYLSDSSKKAGKLRQGYEVARDPTEWEAEQARKAEDEDEDVDMLEEDGEEKPKSKKRKQSGDGKSKDEKAKKEPGSKKRKVRRVISIPLFPHTSARC